MSVDRAADFAGMPRVGRLVAETLRAMKAAARGILHAQLSILDDRPASHV